MKQLVSALALCFVIAITTVSASAATILLEGAGTSNIANPEDGVFLNDEFTFSIAIDGSVQPSAVPNNSLANFENAITSFQVDGIEFVTTPNFVIFGSPFGDSLTIANIGERFRFSQSLPDGTFGTGPFSLDQVLGLELSSFTAPINLRASSLGDGNGEVTSLSISLAAVPLPTGFWLLVSALGVAGMICGRAGQVHPNQVSTWNRRAVEGMADVFARGGAPEGPMQAEVKELHAKVGASLCPPLVRGVAHQGATGPSPMGDGERRSRTI
ncbi:MAG: hypothetical protein AAGC81_19385 [Pseudomonadota bacterium]